MEPSEIKKQSDVLYQLKIDMIANAGPSACWCKTCGIQVQVPDPLQEILDSYKWIKVKKYVMDENASWEDRYKQLEDHHLKETTFLIEKTRELAKELLELKKPS